MGRHGGINILHQKKWHVWRIDNRLQVERDEIAADKAAKKESDAKCANEFEKKVALIKGAPLLSDSEEEENVPKKRGVPPTVVFQKRSKETETSVDAANELFEEDAYNPEWKDGKKPKEEIFYTKDKKIQGKSEYNLQSSSGHINLFADEQAEMEKERLEAIDRVNKQKVNNDLAGVSSKRVISDFNVCRDLKPWYLKRRCDSLLSDEPPVKRS